MDERQEAKLIFEAVHALGIDVPVMSSRIVGDRVELYLYGGQVKVYPADVSPKTAIRTAPPEMAVLQEDPELSPVKAGSSTAAIKNIADYLHPGIRDLENMSLVDLRGLARRWKVPGWNRLNKAKLIEGLRNARV